MLCSRKIVSAKVLKGERTENGSKLYLKSVIKKSYGKITGKYVILFFLRNLTVNASWRNMQPYSDILTFSETF